MSERHGLVRGYLREFLTMPGRHVFVFLLATILLIIVDFEVSEGWHPVRLLELLGIMLFLYMAWVTWRVARILRKQGKP